MGKSKKTLALVMALVMAFTIVPFGAWYGFKAAAEGPSAYAATDAYVPAEELIKGQEYVVAGKTADGRYYAITESNEQSDKGKPAIAQSFDPATGFSDINTEYRATWTYDYSSSSNGWFSHPTSLFTDPSDGNAYIDVNETSSGFGVYAYRNNGQNKHILNTASSEGDGKFALNFTRDGSAYYIELVDQNGGQWFQPTTTRTSLYVFEKPVDAPETTTFPIKIRDLHADSFLIDMASPESVFSLVSGADKITMDTDTVDNGGHIHAALLDRTGSFVNGTNTYRTGLTQENLKDGKLQYSPYTVIYVAHAIWESLYIAECGAANTLAYSSLFANTPFGVALQHKFTREYKDTATWGTDVRRSRWATKPNGEEYLKYDPIKAFNQMLQDASKKQVADNFFVNYLTRSDAEAKQYLENNGITGTNQSILMAYKTTVNRASTITYDRVVNDNPCYDPCTLSERIDDDRWNYSHYTNQEYTYDGANRMDVAYYILHHFFEDSDKATQNVPSGDKESEYEYFSKTVDSAATYLELKRIVKSDGSITYVYDSAYNTSNWGNPSTPIRNDGINQMNYRGVPDSSSENFTPIDNKGFGNSHQPGSGNYSHNYGFSLQGSGKFVYNSSDNLYFEFNGDDDVFLYINGKKVNSVDLGGTHGPVTGSVNLNDIAAEFGLVEGGVYDFDFFYMERNPVGANLKIETNIRVIDTGLFAEKRAVKDGKEIPSGAGVKDGETIYYAISAMNYGATIGGADASAVSNVVLDDSAIGGVKISKDSVIGANAADVRFVLSTYNEATQSWTDKPLENYDAAKPYFASLAPGQKITAFVPYTVDASLIGKSFDNNLYVTAQFATSTGSTEELSAEAHHNLQVFDIDDKTIVIDFAGTLAYDADKLFSNDELRNYEYNDTISVRRTVDSASALRLNADGSAAYTVKDFMDKTDVVTVTEDFYFDHAATPYYTTTKTVTFAPANNVYYDDSFRGIKFNDAWKVDTNAGSVLTGVPGMEEIYGNAGEEVLYEKGAHYIVGNGETTIVDANFTFTGKGYTLYMDTNSASGSILVQTQKLDADGNPDKSTTVLNRLSINSETQYNAVPVVNHPELSAGYGTYQVSIKVSIPEGKVAYLNGIRIYNPMGDDDIGIYVEKNAKFIELRDNLVKSSEILANETEGLLYIDGNAEGAPITDYDKKGPKNEIYLDKGQAVAFRVLGAAQNTKLQVSARNLTADNNVMVVSGMTTTDITSAIDMYYEVVANNGIVTIANTGDGVLALTNLKVTGDGTTTFKMMASRAIAEEAFTLMQTPVEPETPDVPETPEEPETPSKPQNPIVKFFENVKNFFNKIFGKH